MTAIAGTFADFKLVKTRSCAQLVIEVPIEQADGVLAALGGLPRPSKERWVGIAPLKSAPQVQVASQAPDDPFAAPTPFRDLPAAKQAGIKCTDPDFQRWLGADSDEAAAELVRQYCGVNSRSELNADPEAAAHWRKMLGSYEDDRLGRH